MKKEEKNNFSESQIEQLSKIVNESLGSESGISESNNDAKDLETIKIILASILNERHLESLTNLEEEERDDITDAFMLFEYFDNPIILKFIEHRLKLSRSVNKENPKNLLNILSELAGHTGINGMMNEDKTILGRLRGR